MSGPRKRGSRGGSKRPGSPANRGGPPANRKADGGGRRPPDDQRGERGRRPPRSAKGLGGDQVEGRHAVRELLLAGQRRVREVWVIEDLDRADILDDIEELARELRIPHKAVTRRRFQSEALTESHQGVLARAEPVPSVELDRLAQRPGAFLLVLDGVTDPGNLGAILRTAECAGVTGVVLPKHRAVHLTPTVTKTAAGAIEHLPMSLVGGIPTALRVLSEMGVTTVGLDAGGDVGMFDLPIGADDRVALVLGAEGSGLSRLVRERVDHLAAIPLAGRLNSLNVAMAGAVACFEVVRRRGLDAGVGADGAVPPVDGGPGLAGEWD